MRKEEVEQILQENESGLLVYAQRILGDYGKAQDVVQEVFIRFLRKIPPPRSIRSYLFRIAHNLCCEEFRRLRRMPLEEDERGEILQRISDIQRNAEEHCRNKEELTRMRELLQNLDEKKHTMILLKLEQGMSYRQIGEIMGMTPENVGVTLGQTLKKLRRDFRNFADREEWQS